MTKKLTCSVCGKYFFKLSRYFNHIKEHELRRCQMKLAKSDLTMAVWLGKQFIQ